VFHRIFHERVALENTLSNKAAIENRVMQGAVLSVTLFITAMSEKCDWIQESVKIIGYADDWMVLTSHKHVRTSEDGIQTAMHQINKWADNTSSHIFHTIQPEELPNSKKTAQLKILMGNHCFHSWQLCALLF
jgi:hypothetical protein